MELSVDVVEIKASFGPKSTEKPQKNSVRSVKFEEVTKPPILPMLEPVLDPKISEKEPKEPKTTDEKSSF